MVIDMNTHTKALKKLLPKAIITDDKAELEAYKDIIYVHEPSRAQLVVRPGSYEEVSKLLGYCDRHNLAVAPWGGGTNLSGSLTPSRSFVALDIKGLNKVLDFSEDNWTVTVQAGATIEKIENYLNKRGFTLGHDPWSKASATIGGAIALDSAGNLYPKYGSAGDLVLSIKVAVVDGRILTLGGPISKSSSSPRMSCLFIGSAGTLGVILEATMKIAPLAAEHATSGYAFSSFKKMFYAIKELDKAGLTPQSYIGGTLPSVAIKLQPKTEQALVKMLGIDSALFIYYEGNAEDVKVRLKAAKNLLSGFGKKMPDKYAASWWENRHTYFEMNKELADENIHLHVFDFCIPKDMVLTAYTRMDEIAKKQKLEKRISHSLFSALDAYTVALYLEDSKEGMASLRRFEKEAISEVHNLKGTIARTHGLGSLYSSRAIIEKEIGKDALDLLEKMKRTLDPNNILNPGILIRGHEDGGKRRS
ncbi:MAG: FAD-binding oxidoreductase [Methanomassiliicoccales archaeon]|nr:MAG: FAD-binding oxidoreductase [Methanomassiliicoccales archaeon]